MRLSSTTFAEHRARLMARMVPGSIAIIPSSPVKIRSRDTDYAYRQTSDFYYLSGFEEPESLLVLVPGRTEGEFIIFCRPRDKQKEIWQGLMAGPEGAIADFGADQAFPIADADVKIPELLDGSTQVYYPLGRDEHQDTQMMHWLQAVRSKARAGATAPEVFADLDTQLHELRLIKGDAEIAALRASCELAAEAHVRAMQYCSPGVMEFQLEAEILHTFGMAGARAAAYNTIVGGGENACILHYTNNNKRLADGDLVLIDAGCELDYFAADITRTFPVDKKFTTKQKH